MRSTITDSTITLDVDGSPAVVRRTSFLAAASEFDLDARQGLMLAAARVQARREVDARAEVRAEPAPSNHFLVIRSRGASLDIAARFEVGAPDANRVEVAERWLQEEAARTAAATASASESETPESETLTPQEAPMISVRVPDQYQIDVAGLVFTITYEAFVEHWATLDESWGEEADIPMPQLVQRRAAALALKSLFQRHHALDPSVTLDGDVDERGISRYRLARKNAAGQEFLGDWFTVSGLPETHVTLLSGWIARAADALRAVAATKPDTAAREVALGRLRSSGRAADE